jgi:FecR protein
MNVRSHIRIFSVVALLALLTSGAYAQNREKFGISAKAGGVNSVVGHVVVTRAGEKSQTDLTPRDDLESGDVVRTEVGGRVEVLLNPGSYLRVTEDSEFQLVDNSLNHLLVKVTRGSAIVEATGGDKVYFQIGVATPQASFMIVRSGVYRFNVARGATDLLVQKGRVTVEGKSDVIKDGTRVTIAGNAWTTAKLSKSERDEFDAWSKDRAVLLAQANQKLSVRTLNGYLSGVRNTWGFGSGFGSSRFGFWAYSSFCGCFTFFPFNNGWGSPYGGSYGRSGWFYYDPWGSGPTYIVTNPPNGGGGGSQNPSFGNPSRGPIIGTSTSGTSSNSSSTDINTRSSPPSSTVSPPSSQAGPRDPSGGGRIKQP